MIGRTSLFARNAVKSLARYHDHGGVPGGVRYILLYNTRLTKHIEKVDIFPI